MYSPSAHRPEQAPVSLPERRSFLAVVLAAAGGLVSAALAIPLVRFTTFPLRDSAEAASWFDDDEIWSIVSYLRHLPPVGSVGEPEMGSH
jgi:hypothetical protein